MSHGPTSVSVTSNVLIQLDGSRRYLSQKQTSAHATLC